ncbi:MAG: sugar ABC transporter ATP-binding protein [Desulfotalea sp.]|nr:MAG: sugar ABC transporter ATP-binding protein [Desulfotalea sp.]
MPDQTPFLHISKITKKFGSVFACDSVTLQLQQGEILALLGENGAGKTTLMNILFGHYVADSGSISIGGKELTPGSPRRALKVGLGMVHQHFSLADNMSVLDNITLGTESMFGLWRKSGEARQKINKLINTYELDVDPRSIVKNLSVGQRQRVEILKALYRDSRILILDEPTAVLTPQEAEHLFATLRLLVDKGLAIIFITHKLREVMAVSDRCLVLRHGKVSYESRTRDTDVDTLAREMVGGEVPVVEQLPTSPGKKVLSLEGVGVKNSDGYSLLHDVSLELRGGEIIGIAGVSGNGQSHLADLISGLLSADKGSFELLGEAVVSPTPMGMLKRGVGRIPEDRTGTGLVGDMNVQENLILENYWTKKVSHFGLLKADFMRKNAKDIMEQYDVRCGGEDLPVRLMSGGNMQKLILGRVLSEEPSVIMANQPTWGLDVGAAAFVHSRLIRASRDGVGIIIISEDLDELFKVADVIQVMYKGTLSPPVRPADTDAREMGLAMSGHLEVFASTVAEAHHEA